MPYHRDSTIAAQFHDHVRRGLAEASEPLPYVNPGRSKPVSPASDTISRKVFDRAKHQHAVDTRLAEITQLRGAKLLQAIISLKSAWDQVSRSVFAGIEADQIAAAEQWDSTRRQRLAANRARRSEQRS